MFAFNRASGLSFSPKEIIGILTIDIDRTLEIHTSGLEVNQAFIAWSLDNLATQILGDPLEHRIIYSSKPHPGKKMRNIYLNIDISIHYQGQRERRTPLTKIMRLSYPRLG